MGNACLVSALFLPLPKRGLWSLSCALKALNLLFSCEEEDVLCTSVLCLSPVRVLSGMEAAELCHSGGL